MKGLCTLIVTVGLLTITGIGLFQAGKEAGKAEMLNYATNELDKLKSYVEGYNNGKTNKEEKKPEA